MTKTEKEIYIDTIMGAKELKTLLNGKEKTLKNISNLNKQELIDNMNFINNQIKTTHVSTKIDMGKIPHKIKDNNTGEILIFSHLFHGKLSYMKTVFAGLGRDGFEHISESDLHLYEILEQKSTKTLSQELAEKYMVSK